MRQEELQATQLLLDGTLSVRSARALLRGVRGDPELTDELAAQQHLHGLLEAAFGPDPDCTRLARLVQTAIEQGRSRGDRPVKMRTERRVSRNLKTRSQQRPVKVKTRSHLRNMETQMLPAQRPAKYKTHARLRNMETQMLPAVPAALPPARRPAFLPKKLGLAAGILVALGAVYFAHQKFFQRPAPPAEILATSTDVTVCRGTAVLPAGTRMLLRAGDRLKIGPAGTAEIALCQGAAHMTLSANTAVRFPAAADAFWVEITRGASHVSVLPQPPGSKLAFISPHAEVWVYGTRFDLTVEQDQTRVSMQEGEVTLKNRRNGRQLPLRAGYDAIVGATITIENRASRKAPALRERPERAAPHAPPAPQHAQPAPAPPPGARPRVESFTLIDALRDRPIPEFDPIPDGATINLAALPTRSLNIRANLRPKRVGSVRFSLDGQQMRRLEEGTAGSIYSLAGDMHGDYHSWQPEVGWHVVAATPYTEDFGMGEAGDPLRIRFRVIDEADPPSP